MFDHNLFLVILVAIVQVRAYEVIYAINAGGEAVTDSTGIEYQADPLTNKIGTASDFGKNLLTIRRVKADDDILFRTERYHTSNFGYTIPLTGDGNYLLVLKFCEVYFNAPNMKVFDVILNKKHTIVKDLDIFDETGRGTAYEEYIYFYVKNNQLTVNNEKSDVKNNKVYVEFIKGRKDNPKINAIVLAKGNLNDFPKLPPMYAEPETVPTEETEPVVEDESPRNRKSSGPKQPNPYMLEEAPSAMLPIFIAIAVFIPTLFCICKL